MNKKIIILPIVTLLALLTSSISAGVIYASKWKKGDQAVCLYADDHETHKLFGSCENESFGSFYKNLKASTQRWLLLCEDMVGDKFDSNLGLEIVDKEPHFTFLNGIKWFRRKPEYQIPHVETKNIDMRSDIANIILLLDCYRIVSGKDSELMSSVNAEDYNYFKTFYKKIYNTFKDMRLSDLLESPLTTLHECIQSTSNDELKAILTNVFDTLKVRQNLLTQVGLTDFVAPLLIDEQTFAAHEKVFDLITNPIITVSYLCETVEALALWNIIENQAVHKRIAVVAGSVHILQLEDFLQRLGYSKIDCFGEENKKLVLESEELLLDFFIKQHELIQPLDKDFNDITCNFLRFTWALKENLSEFTPDNANNIEAEKSAQEKQTPTANAAPQELYTEFKKWAEQQQEKISECSNAMIPISHDAFLWLSEDK